MMEIEGLKPKQPSTVGSRSLAQGYMTPAIKRREQKRPTVPNRKWRRMELANAPRGIRVQAKKHRATYQFAHQPHMNSVKRWLDPEALQAYLEYDPGTQLKIRRQIRNTVRRKRQALCA